MIIITQAVLIVSIICVTILAVYGIIKTYKEYGPPWE